MYKLRLFLISLLATLVTTYAFSQIQVGWGLMSTNAHQTSIENGNSNQTSAHLDGTLFIGYEWSNKNTQLYFFQSGIQRYAEILGTVYSLDYIRVGVQYSRSTGGSNPRLNFTIGTHVNFADRTFSKTDSKQFRSTGGLFQKSGFMLKIGKQSSAELGIAAGFDLGAFKHIQNEDALKFVNHGVYFQYMYAVNSLFKKNRTPE